MKIGKRDASLAVAILLLTIATAPKPVAATLVLAQTAFPVPASVPQGTTLRIDGSTSMTAINQALSDRFKAKFPGAAVNASYDGSDAALQAVLDGKIDLAAIGSPLTPEQKAKGLVEVPVARHKVAVFVGANNPFANSLTGEQFASIFRGELTDWSQVGGAPAPIRVIDRPDSSDTRRAFPRYPVFQAAPFQAGATTTKLDSDSTDAVIEQLGNDGISYAIADQVVNNPAVRVLPMYGTLPSDPSYPFSQPLSYVYNGAKPSAAVLAFLGFATAPESQTALEAARVAAATGAVQAAAPAPTGAAGTDANPATGSPNAQGGSPTAEGTASSPAGLASPAGSVAPTEASPPGTPAGTTAPTGTIASTDSPGLGEGGLGGGILSRWWWLIPALASLGVLAWLLRGRSATEAPVAARVRANPGMMPTGEAIAPGGLAAGAALGATALGAAGATAADATGTGAIVPALHDSRIILTPRTCREAYAYWEVDAAHQTLLEQQGGTQLALRLYDVTDIDMYYQAPHSVHEFACDPEAKDLHVPIPTDDRDYIAELGYTTDDHRWLPLARSPHVRVPACTEADPDVDTGATDLFGSTSTDYAGTDYAGTNYAGTEYTTDSNKIDRDRFTLDAPSAKDIAATSAAATGVAAISQSAATDRPANRLILVPRSAEDLYAYWELPEQQQQAMQQQGGRQLILRVYDITGVDLSHQPPRSVQQFECDKEAHDRHVSVPSYGDYVATLGYMTPENRWVSLARSTPVRIREAGSSTPRRDRD